MGRGAEGGVLAVTLLGMGPLVLMRLGVAGAPPEPTTVPPLLVYTGLRSRSPSR
jgi:hypothetical protein